MAVRMAAVPPATMLHRADDLGGIPAGCLANRVVGRGSPREVIRALSDPMAIKNGAVAVERR